VKKIYLVLIGVFVFTCGKQPVPSNRTIEDYFPYDEYNELTFRSILNGTDTTFSTETVNSRSLRYMGQVVYQVNSYYYQVLIDGEWREYDGVPSDTTPYPLICLKEPLEIGTEQMYYINSWSCIISDIDVSLRTARMGIVNNCIELIEKTETGFGRDTIYYALGYGEIRVIFYDYHGRHFKELIEAK